MKLKNGDNGILGFENIKEWTLENLEDGLYKLEEVDTKKTNPDYRASFALLSSEFFKSYGRAIPNMGEGIFYVLFNNGDGPCINTKNPLKISDGLVDQNIMPTGSVLQPLKSLMGPNEL